MSRPNGANRLGLWLSIVISLIIVLGMIGSVFYVAFETRANGDAIIALSITFRTIAEDKRLLELRVSGQELALNEIETQFAAQDIIRNLMHANDQRIQSMLWGKTFGSRLPTDNTYYPTISNRKIK